MTASSCVSRKLNVYISKNGQKWPLPETQRVAPLPSSQGFTLSLLLLLQLLRLQEGSHLWAAVGHEMGTLPLGTHVELLPLHTHCQTAGKPQAHSAGYSFWIRHRWWGFVALHHRDEDQHLPFQAKICKAKLSFTLILTVVANPDLTELFSLHRGIDEKRHSSAREGKDTPHWAFRGDKISLAGKVETELAGRKWRSVQSDRVGDWRWQLEYSENRKASQLCTNRTRNSSKAKVSKKN